MHSSETTFGNRILATLPDHPGSHFIYREARWVDLAVRSFVAALGIGLAVAATVSLGKAPLAFPLLFLAGAAMLLFGAFFLRTAGATLFVCSPAGLYFPAMTLFARHPECWLLVPWQNVLDYRVQRLLDETSSLGVVLTVAASPDEEAVFLAQRSVLTVPPVIVRRAERLASLGYATFLPRPDAVIVELRRYDARSRRVDEAGAFAEQLAVAGGSD